VHWWISRVMVALGVMVTVVGGSTAAWAHDVVAPATVVAGSKVTVTVAVVNEHELPSDGVEMQLPPGFALKAPEGVPGWRTDVLTRADGTANAVRWTGGLIEANALSEFVVTGTAPAAAGSLVWSVSQKSVGAKEYVAPPVSAAPHMTVSAAPLGGTKDSGESVPLATTTQTSTGPLVDGVARSRATLALVLAGLALLGVVAFGSATVRRSQQTPQVEPAAVAPPADTKTTKPAKARGKGDSSRALSSSAGGRR
jgi:uncharacterized protein DUF1775